jgi:hypothetical protein
MVIIDVCLGFWTGCVYSELLSNFGAIFGVSRSDECSAGSKKKTHCNFCEKLEAQVASVQ